MACTIVWFRRDLRVNDHAPLRRASLRGQVIPVFVFDPALLHHPETGSGRVAFLLSCLAALDQDLRRLGGRLILRYGDPVEVLPALIGEAAAEGIYAHTDCERIYGRARDARLNRALSSAGLAIRWFEPFTSTPELLASYQFRQWWEEQMRQDPISEPARVEVPSQILGELLPTLEQLGHRPDQKRIPPGGTQAARRLLRRFLADKTSRYYWQLSYPSAEVTSGLSPHLKFGAISVRECYQAALPLRQDPDPRRQRSAKQFLARLRWASSFTQRFRYLPQLEICSLYAVFDRDPPTFDAEAYQAWQEGRTGFPMVDAAARCLAATGGWLALNFRIRALYASFLSNLLGIDWRYGALHFMRHLIDGDCPIDHYQWAMQAGIAQAADKTWTRIYNPEQAAIDRCDPDGSFVKRWLPELAGLPAHQLGSPPPLTGYPDPILSYAEARRRRVLYLEERRRHLLPHLARLPQDVTPFGAELFPAAIVSWASRPAPELFPPAIDLDALDPAAALLLNTWLVGGPDVRPRRSPPRRSVPQDPPEEGLQLSLEI